MKEGTETAYTLCILRSLVGAASYMVLACSQARQHASRAVPTSYTTLHACACSWTCTYRLHITADRPTSCATEQCGDEQAPKQHDMAINTVIGIPVLAQGSNWKATGVAYAKTSSTEELSMPLACADNRSSGGSLVLSTASASQVTG